MQCSDTVGVSYGVVPTLGVSSLDLGRSYLGRPLSSRPSHTLHRRQRSTAQAFNGSACLTYASVWLLQCRKKPLPIVRRTVKLGARDWRLYRSFRCPPWAF